MVYVLTEETNSNNLMGVYSTMEKATVALWHICEGCEPNGVEVENVGVRFRCVNVSSKEEYSFYIERIGLDDAMFLKD